MSFGIISDAARQFSSDSAYVTAKGSAAANAGFLSTPCPHALRLFANGVWTNAAGGGSSFETEFRGLFQAVKIQQNSSL
jgi:hypothetical protein